MLNPYFDKHLIEAGCDEAGRGCLAGAVFAAAVIFPKEYKNSKLNDSKKLSEALRLELKPEIEKYALAFGVGVVNQKEIDKINILNASILAMHRAIRKLKIKPELLLIDGNRFKKYKEINHHCIVKGDGKYQSIAAASVLAKTYRDEYMNKMDKQFPEYQWKKNKGYPTYYHRQAIIKYGISEFHRLSFKLNPTQLELEI